VESGARLGNPTTARHNVPTMAGRTVIGRDEELGSIQVFLAGVDQGPSALVLSGEPGIGKSILWEAGVQHAQSRFTHVLSHRSVEAESLLSFAGLSDLLVRSFDEVAPSLVPIRRHALEVALLLAEPGENPPDALVIGVALLDVLRALAEAGSVLVALDEVQWLDPASTGVLQVALRRLAGERVGLLASLREVPGVHSRAGLASRLVVAADEPAQT
jgi:predicted ATPase